MKVKLTISYDGTAYNGWQVQPDKITIQGLVEEALYNATGERKRITGSGRTDAGVHAKGQVAHVTLEKSTIPAEKLYRAMNIYLPYDVRVIKSEQVDDDFDACRKAKKKTYCYTMYKGDVENPLLERYAVMIPKNVDVKKMQEASKCLLGEHDFKSVSASGNSTLSTVRTIYSLDVIEKDEFVTITITGNGFLYNMVRIISGVLLMAGENKITCEEIKEILDKKDRTLFPKTLPAKALCLVDVKYE